jgi:hypothetical protein
MALRQACKRPSTWARDERVFSVLGLTPENDNKNERNSNTKRV